MDTALRDVEPERPASREFFWINRVPFTEVEVSVAQFAAQTERLAFSLLGGVSTTNVALPVSQWTEAGSGTFGAGVV